MKNYLLAFIGCSLLFLASCSPKIPFTQAIREQNKLTPEELKRIQFYISGPVVLRKGSATEKEKTTDEGKLIIKSGKSIDQVMFKAKTKGTVDQVVDINNLKVAFEDGAEKSLVFSSKTDRNGYYRLIMLNDNGKYKVNYGGESYNVVNGSEQSILLFKMKSLKELKVNEKVVKGRKVK